MKTLIATACLSLSLAAGAASAATVNAVSMKQNDWIVLEIAPGSEGFKITPGSTDGSFSYSFGSADTLCPQSWACMPKDKAFGTIYTSGGDFGYGWSPISASSVKDERVLNGSKTSNYFFFRVTSGSGSITDLSATRVPTPPVTPPLAAVPLPATALLLLGGIGGLGVFASLRRRRKAA